MRKTNRRIKMPKHYGNGNMGGTMKKKKNGKKKNGTKKKK